MYNGELSQQHVASDPDGMACLELRVSRRSLAANVYSTRH